MMNTLNADSVLRQRCQICLYFYSSSKPLIISAAEFRDELTAMIHQLDPEGRDTALQQMVKIGHSQGGLLARMTATDPGDQSWQVLSDKPLEALQLSEAKRPRRLRRVRVCRARKTFLPGPPRNHRGGPAHRARTPRVCFRRPGAIIPSAVKPRPA